MRPRVTTKTQRARTCAIRRRSSVITPRSMRAAGPACQGPARVNQRSDLWTSQASRPRLRVHGQRVADHDPGQLRADLRVILGRQQLWVVERTDGDVDFRREVGRTKRQWCAASRAKGPRPMVRRSKAVRRSGQKPKAGGRHCCPGNKRCAAGPPADRTVTVRLIARRTVGSVPDETTEAAPLDHRDTFLVRSTYRRSAAGANQNVLRIGTEAMLTPPGRTSLRRPVATYPCRA